MLSRVRAPLGATTAPGLGGLNEGESDMKLILILF
jgi:hypothetical protein